jgi:hypothetical protein
MTFTNCASTYAIQNLLRAVRTKIENAAVLEKIFLKSESFRSNLQLLVFNLQVFLKIAPCLGGLKGKRILKLKKY